MRPDAPVQVTTTSAEASASTRSAQGTVRAAYARARCSALAWVRLAMITSAAPDRVSVATDRALMAPAPMTSTDRSVSGPTCRSASSSPALTSDRDTSSSSVSVWARLPTRRARWNNALSSGPTSSRDWAARRAERIWPRIWLSPIAMESRPQATEKAWETARSSWWT